jgi:hypothetical protein
MAAAPSTPPPRVFALNVIANHYYGLDLAVTVAGADDRYNPQASACVPRCLVIRFCFCTVVERTHTHTEDTQPTDHHVRPRPID